jgi:hypothetical protein
MNSKIILVMAIVSIIVVGSIFSVYSDSKLPSFVGVAKQNKRSGNFAKTVLFAIL